MRRALADTRVFLGEFRRNFATTGAILPSSRRLARALTRFIEADQRPRRILEVGPGTGAVTATVVRRMGPADELHLVELNETFIRRLHHRFETDPAFRRVAPRAKLSHCRVEELPRDTRYDLIVSGLPLNNFDADLVRHILETLEGLLAPGGVLSFFQYVGIRSARAMVSRRAERDRLEGIDRALRTVLEQHEIRRDLVWTNVPPAWVHHIRFGANGQTR